MIDTSGGEEEEEAEEAGKDSIDQVEEERKIMIRHAQNHVKSQ